MDPLSIAASAAGIAALLGTLVASVSRLVADVSNADESARNFHASLTALKSVLGSVESTFAGKPAQHGFERKHWEDIRRILHACSQCVYQLNHEMPRLPQPSTPTSASTTSNALVVSGSTSLATSSRTEAHIEGNSSTTVSDSVIKKTYQQFLRYARSNVVVSLRGHISSYTQCLQVSLSAITVVAQWRTRESQDQIKLEVQRLRSDIKSAIFLLRQPQQFAAMNLDSASRIGSDEIRQVEGAKANPLPIANGSDLTLATMSAKRNIEQWWDSAETVIYNIARYEPDQTFQARKTSERDDIESWTRSVAPSIMDDSESIREEDPYETSGILDSGVDVDDTETECEFVPKVELNERMMTRLIEDLRHIVQDKMEAGFYGSVEKDQKEVISLCERREQTHGVNFDNRAMEEETLANIYVGQGQLYALKRAEIIFQQLLKQEREQPSSSAREWSLYHSLAVVYAEQGRIKIALEFAKGAFVGRDKPEADQQLAAKSGWLFAELCHQTGDFHTSNVVKDDLRERFGPEVPTAGGTAESAPDAPTSPVDRVNSEGPRTNLYNWLQENGFEQDTGEEYLFDRPHPQTQLTPVHVAIGAEDVDILEGLLNAGASTSITDPEGNAPLLLAASKRNQRLVRTLLGKEADTRVTDSVGNTALHRVQGDWGGVISALLLLRHTDPINVNECNNFGQTALHRAVKFGNAAMIEALVAEGADVNVRDKGMSTPLHVAIDHRREDMVKMLLEIGGTQTDAKNLDGAIEAAQGATPALPRAKAYLERAKERRQRSSSSASSAGRTSSASDPSPEARQARVSRRSTWRSRG